MSTIIGGVRIGSFVSPTDTLDTYPTHNSIYGKGGHREVSTIVERDAIYDDRRSEGMTCYVIETGVTYILKGGILNTNWVLYENIDTLIINADYINYPNDIIVPSADIYLNPVNKVEINLYAAYSTDTNYIDITGTYNNGFTVKVIDYFNSSFLVILGTGNTITSTVDIFQTADYSGYGICYNTTSDVYYFRSYNRDYGDSFEFTYCSNNLWKVNEHNQLAGLQGGDTTSGEFYHLTKDEFNLFNTFWLDPTTTSETNPYVAGTNGERNIKIKEVLTQSSTDIDVSTLTCFIYLPCKLQILGTYGYDVGQTITDRQEISIFPPRSYITSDNVISDGALVIAVSNSGDNYVNRSLVDYFPTLNTTLDGGVLSWQYIKPGRYTLSFVYTDISNQWQYNSITGCFYDDGTNHADGWGNPPGVNINGYAKRCTLTESQYTNFLNSIGDYTYHSEDAIINIGPSKIIDGISQILMNQTHFLNATYNDISANFIYLDSGFEPGAKVKIVDLTDNNFFVLFNSLDAISDINITNTTDYNIGIGPCYNTSSNRYYFRSQDFTIGDSVTFTNVGSNLGNIYWTVSIENNSAWYTNMIKWNQVDKTNAIADDVGAIAQITALTPETLVPLDTYKFPIATDTYAEEAITIGTLRSVLDPVTFSVSMSGSGMGAIITTIATRTDATTDGWYKITDEANVVQLRYNSSWILTPVVTESEVSTSPYIIGSNNEDILYVDTDNARLILPNSGLTKQIQIISKVPNFYLRRTSDDENSILAYISAHGSAGHWYKTSAHDFIKSNSIGDTIVINAGVLSSTTYYHGIASTSLLAYINRDSSGGWYNEPEKFADGGIARCSITSTQLSDLDNIGTVSSGITTAVPSFSATGLVLDVGQCDVKLYDNSTFAGVPKKYTISSAQFTLTDDSVNYIVAKYNSGIPIYGVTLNVGDINESDVVPVNTILVEGGICHLSHWDRIADGLPNKLHRRFVKTQRYSWESGLAISVNGTNVTISSGIAWRGARDFNLLETHSDGTNNSQWFICYHSSGNWILDLSVGGFDNTNYDNGTNLTPLGSNKYNINWIFRGIEDHQHGYVVLSDKEYKDLPTAIAETKIPSLPPRISTHAMLIGRIIFKNGVAIPGLIEGAFEKAFYGTVINEHNNLAGLQGGDPVGGEFYHVTQTELGNMKSGSSIATNLAASDTILALKAIRISGQGTVAMAESDQLSHMGSVIGVSTSGALTNGYPEVQMTGIVSDISLVLTAGLPVYFDGLSNLTQTEPTVGFIQQIGIAISTNDMLISIKEPIEIA